MIITFANLAMTNPEMKIIFWIGCFLGCFVTAGSLFMSYYTKKRAIKALCQIHERKTASPSNNGTT